MSNKWWSNQAVKNGWNCPRATGFGLVIHWVKNGGNFPSHTRLGLADLARRQTKMAGIGHVLLGLVWLAGSVGSLEDSFPRTPIINTRHHTPDISLTCDDLCFFLDCPFTWLPYFSSQSTCYTFQKSLKSRYLDLHLLKNFSDLEKMKMWPNYGSLMPCKGLFLPMGWGNCTEWFRKFNRNTPPKNFLLNLHRLKTACGTLQ